MCDPVSIGVAVASVAASAVMAPKAPSASAPAAATPAPQSQVAKMPDQAAVRRQGAAGTTGAAPAAGSTMLTGPGGVSPGALSLGKSTLLGM